MKNKKIEKIQLKNCVECLSCVLHNNFIYCKLRMKDDNIYAESAKVIQEDCKYYDERKIDAKRWK